MALRWKSNPGKETAVCIPCAQDLTLRADGGLCYSATTGFVNFHAFENTGHTDNPLHFSWRVQMLNSLSHFALLWVNKPGKDCNASELARVYPLVILPSCSGRGRVSGRDFEDEEKRTFNGKKLTKLLCALVLACVNQDLRYIVWPTITE